MGLPTSSSFLLLASQRFVGAWAARGLDIIPSSPSILVVLGLGVGDTGDSQVTPCTPDSLTRS